MQQKYKWLIISILSGLVLSAAYLAISNLMDYERSKATAEEKERQAVALSKIQEENQKRFEAYIQDSQRQMQQMAAQQAALAQSMVARAQVYQGQVQQIQKATSTEDIVKQLKDYLQVTATSPAPGMVTLPAEQAQKFVILDLENKRIKADFEDLKEQFELEKNKSATLNQSLAQALKRVDEQTELVQMWKEVSQSWKTTAKKSKFKRFLDFAKPAAFAIIAGVVVGQVTK